MSADLVAPPPSCVDRGAPFALTRGARVRREGGVEFRVWAPRARRMQVVLDAGRTAIPLEPDAGCVFGGVAEDAGADSDYRFRLDAGEPVPDPVSRFQPGGVHGASRVVDPTGFRWSDAGWRGVPRPALVFYELHVGTFSDTGDFRGVAERLPALRALGVTALELMPVAQFPGTRNWGYDGVFPYAPQASYGGPDGLRTLVDAAHGEGLAVVLDVVYNHLGPEGNVLPRFGPYFTDRYRTPWGDAINFDGAGSDEVRRYFIDNALYWLAEYHLDGLRLDAVHAIRDASARPFLAELAAEVHALSRHGGRVLHLLPESDANDPRLVRSPRRGGFGLDAVWNDDFHHAVHAVLTGERDGYYVDYGSTTQIAKALRDRFVYDGCHSAFRQRRHGAPATDLPGDRFVVAVQNHDQVGNRPLGERLSMLVSPARQRLAAALMLASPYLPLLFMGEEYGETRPFLYFVDHADEALLRAVRDGRRRELAGGGWEGVPDPGAPAAFEASRLRPEQAGLRGRALHALYVALLRLRREERALTPGRAAVEADSPREGTVRLVHRLAGGGSVLALFQIGASLGETPVPRGHGTWQRLLDTDESRFGGPGPRAPERLPGGGWVRLPSDVAWLYRDAR